MIIQLVTRTFTNKDEANIFEYFFCKQWKDLIKNIPNCKLRLIYDKEKPNTFNALWEFPNRFTQNRVMKLIKKTIQGLKELFQKKLPIFLVM